jgi:BioD-like phosphotransacetylase family protein
MWAIAAQNAEIISSLQQEFSSRDDQRLESLLLATALLAERWQSDEKLKSKVRSLSSLVQMYVEHPTPRVQGAAILACGKILEDRAFAKLKKRFEKSTDPVILARLRQAAEPLK